MRLRADEAGGLLRAEGARVDVERTARDGGAFARDGPHDSRADVGTDLPADRVARLVAARFASGHGVVRIAGAANLAAESRHLDGVGVRFEVIPGVIEGGA